jgi:hypothetical protein
MGDTVITRMPGVFKSGTITATGTPQVIDMTHANMPCTVYLNTTYASKLIELSVDGGSLFFTPAYDTSNASQLVVKLMSPVSHVRLTGTAGDVWGIR